MKKSSFKKLAHLMDLWGLVLPAALYGITYSEAFPKIASLFSKGHTNLLASFLGNYILLSMNLLFFVSLVIIYIRFALITTLIIWPIGCGGLIYYLFIDDGLSIHKMLRLIIAGTLAVLAVLYLVFYMKQRVAYTSFMISRSLNFQKDNICGLFIALMIAYLITSLITDINFRISIINGDVGVFKRILKYSLIYMSVISLSGFIKTLTYVCIIQGLPKPFKHTKFSNVILMIGTYQIYALLFIVGTFGKSLGLIKYDGTKKHLTSRLSKLKNLLSEFCHRLANDYLDFRLEHVLLYAVTNRTSFFHSLTKSTEGMKLKKVIKHHSRKVIYSTFFVPFWCFASSIIYFSSKQNKLNGSECEKFALALIIIQSVFMVEFINAGVEILLFLYSEKPELLEYLDPTTFEFLRNFTEANISIESNIKKENTVDNGTMDNGTMDNGTVDNCTENKYSGENGTENKYTGDNGTVDKYTGDNEIEVTPADIKETETLLNELMDS